MICFLDKLSFLIMPKKKDLLVTKEGLRKLKEELEFRSTVKKDQLKENLNSAMESGDLSENDAYTIALDAQLANDHDIEILKEKISNAKVVENNKKGTVELGDSIVIKDSSGTEKKLTIVSENEIDPVTGKISMESPLGKSILGKKKGDKFKFKTPRGEVEYTIVDAS